MHRKAGPQPEAALSSRPDVEVSSIDRDPFAHSEQTVSTVAATVRSTTVVDDLDFDLPGGVAHPYLGTLRRRMLDRVGQPLLNEPVRSEVDACRQGDRLPLHPPIHHEPPPPPLRAH